MSIIYRIGVILGCLLIGALLPTAAIAAPPPQADSMCSEDYTVQGGDWLSTIAEKYYGDVLAYTAIVEATNQASLTDDTYLTINNPGLIEVGQVLCIPSNEDAEAMVNAPSAVTVTDTQPTEEMLIIAGNRSALSQDTFLTISGELLPKPITYEIDAGKEVRISLEPGEYMAQWETPEGVTFGREFLAIAGRVVITWVVPEDGYVHSELQRSRAGGEIIGQLNTPSVTTSETPYSVVDGKGVLVAGNRSRADIPSTLTITGGKFGGGKEFDINPFQEVIIVFDEGEYTLTWSAPGVDGGEPVAINGRLIAIPGTIDVIWIVPEAGRAFVQSPGEPGEEVQ